MKVIIIPNCNLLLCIGHTKPEVTNCVRCARQFLAPIEDTICDLPDGSSVAYSEPITLCPLCDDNQFGAFMNKDFMPELADY